jgi:hypothetical protein
MVLRLDRELDTFLAALDDKVGRGEWAMIVTSDHGASPLPESLGGGRMAYEAIARAANVAAVSVLGPGEWIASASYPNIYFTAAALARPATELDAAKDKVLLALRALPAIARAERTAELAGNCDARSGDDQAICLMLDPERSGELFYLPNHGFIWEEEHERLATAHGSFHPYDRDVPVILLEPGRQMHGPLEKPSVSFVPMRLIAGILAGWLGVTL